MERAGQGWGWGGFLSPTNLKTSKWDVWSVTRTKSMERVVSDAHDSLQHKQHKAIERMTLRPRANRSEFKSVFSLLRAESCLATH